MYDHSISLASDELQCIGDLTLIGNRAILTGLVYPQLISNSLRTAQCIVSPVRHTDIDLFRP